MVNLSELSDHGYVPDDTEYSQGLAAGSPRPVPQELQEVVTRTITADELALAGGPIVAIRSNIANTGAQSLEGAAKARTLRGTLGSLATKMRIAVGNDPASTESVEVRLSPLEAELLDRGRALDAEKANS